MIEARGAFTHRTRRHDIRSVIEDTLDFPTQLAPVHTVDLPGDP